GRAEMADRERVAAEVHGVEAVVHDELRAHGVIDTRREDVRLFRQQPAQPLAGRFVTRRGDLVALREEGRGDEIHQGLLDLSSGLLTRYRIVRTIRCWRRT